MKKKIFLPLLILFIACLAMAQVSRLRVNTLLVDGSPWVDVTHPTYGAVGNGVTDDATAIQAAIDAAEASNKTVYFPSGTYVIGSPISTSGIDITGSGTASTVLSLTGTGAISYTNATSVTGSSLRDLTISTALTAVDMLTINKQTRFELVNVNIVGPGGAGTTRGLVITNTNISIFRDMRILNTCSDALYIQGDGGASNYFESIYAVDYGGIGVHLVRTTATDVGGWNFLNIVATSSVATSSAWKIESSAEGTELPLFCNQCTADNSKANHAFWAINVGQLQISDLWATVSGTNGNGTGYSAVYFDKVFNSTTKGGHYESADDVIWVANASSYIQFIAPYLYGRDDGNGVKVASGCSSIDFIRPFTVSCATYTDSSTNLNSAASSNPTFNRTTASFLSSGTIQPGTLDSANPILTLRGQGTVFVKIGPNDSGAQQLSVTSAADTAVQIAIAPPTAGQAGSIVYYDAVTSKWIIGKNTANSYVIFDDTADISVLEAESNGSTRIRAQSGVIFTAASMYPETDNTYYLGKNDDDTPFAWKGIILKDQTTGTYYRLEVNSGSLSIVDLTD